ncbi:hypothetical protein NKH77_33895 [Streptomyces sp. M19]
MHRGRRRHGRPCRRPARGQCSGRTPVGSRPGVGGGRGAGSATTEPDSATTEPGSATTAGTGSHPTVLLPPTGTADPVAQARLLVERVTSGDAPAELVVLTRRATPAGDTAPDPVGAALWAAVRSLQAAGHETVTVIDLDTEALDPETLLAALASDEPQLAISDGKLLVPRLLRTPWTADPARHLRRARNRRRHRHGHARRSRARPAPRHRAPGPQPAARPRVRHD